MCYNLRMDQFELFNLIALRCRFRLSIMADCNGKLVDFFVGQLTSRKVIHVSRRKSI